MSARAQKPVQSENDWRDQTIIPYARLKGWAVHFTHTSKHSPSGWPDLVLVRGQRLLVRELKTARGRLTAAQWDWLLALQRAGVDVGVWRPSMWAEIQQELT